MINQLSLNHVALALDLAADLPAVRADANQMQQVVVNLLLNAADAVSNGNGGGGIRLASRPSELPPFGHTPIRKASCPKGCDLLDPSVRIGGLPSIGVLRSGARGEAVVHLDPIYGRSNHIASNPCEEGVVAAWSCLSCRVSLAQRDRPCARCGASSFAVLGPEGEPIEWCARKGCGWSRWERIESAGAGRYAEISVTDQGCGISTEDQQHLFEPFFSTKGRRGTGLGLAVTWGIVESHGGTIEVESEEGKGSRFTVRLPVDAGQAGVAGVRRRVA